WQLGYRDDYRDAGTVAWTSRRLPRRMFGCRDDCLDNEMAAWMLRRLLECQDGRLDVDIVPWMPRQLPRCRHGCLDVETAAWTTRRLLRCRDGCLDCLDDPSFSSLLVTFFLNYNICLCLCDVVHRNGTVRLPN
ncbi:hypothetical protein AMTR_s00124p00045850, partial [Amborella trichopoda]